MSTKINPNQIATDSGHRFVTDDNIAKLNGIADNATNTPLAADLSGNEISKAANVKAINDALALHPTYDQTLSLTPADQAALDIQVDYIPSIQKLADGTIKLNAITKAIDIFLPPTANQYLIDPAGWGNVQGQNGEYKIISGIDNLDGGAGRQSQLIVIAGTLYVCIAHDLGTTTTNGSATYVRNRSVNFLNSSFPNYADISVALLVEANFNDQTNIGILLFKCTPGTIYQTVASGWQYVCIDDFTWARTGSAPPYKPMAIDAATCPNLITHFAAHDFTTGPYVQGSLTDTVDETTYQGQKYWTDTYFIEKGLAGKWYKVATNNIA